MKLTYIQIQLRKKFTGSIPVIPVQWGCSRIGIGKMFMALPTYVGHHYSQLLNIPLRALTGKAYILAKWKRRLISAQDYTGSNPVYEQTAFSTCAK